MDNSKLINEIKIFRARFNISQRELAEAVSVTRKTINTIETGKFIPSTILSLKIAQYFQTSVEEIFKLDQEN